MIIRGFRPFCGTPDLLHFFNSMPDTSSDHHHLVQQHITPTPLSSIFAGSNESGRLATKLHPPPSSLPVFTIFRNYRNRINFRILRNSNKSQIVQNIIIRTCLATNRPRTHPMERSGWGVRQVFRLTRLLNKTKFTPAA